MADGQAREMLLVQSKVREIIKGRGESARRPDAAPGAEVKAKDEGWRVSEDFLNSLNDELYRLIDKAISRCKANDRKTLGASDV